MAIVLSRIYTRAGDDGTTALGDMSRVRKTDPRLGAYAAVDEANAALGLVLALGAPEDDVAEAVRRMQHDLFDVGADLCTPIVEGEQRLRIEKSYVTRLEEAIDHFNEGLPALRSFVLPGGSPAAALLHSARTTVRDAERRAWTLLDASPDDSNVWTARYLNRAADLLFVLARYANRETGDVTWTPGANR
jgi:cob(I)alamin adenosyltransferase